MTFKPPPGWFVDAMTVAVAELVEEEKLPKGEHVSALALTAAILVHALASHSEVK